MAIYASSHSRGTERVDVVTLGTISPPQAALATGQQLVVARAARPSAEPAEPTNVPAAPTQQPR